jgi:hypothetical protein
MTPQPHSSSTIYKPEEIPETPKLIQLYAQRYLPQSNAGERFTNLHLKADEPLDDTLSTTNNNMGWWYKDNKTYCFKKVLLLHDKTTIIGMITWYKGSVC